MQPIDFCALNAKSNRSTVFVNDTGNIINDYVDKMIARILLLVCHNFGTPFAYNSMFSAADPFSVKL